MPAATIGGRIAEGTHPTTEERQTLFRSGATAFAGLLRALIVGPGQKTSFGAFDGLKLILLPGDVQVTLGNPALSEAPALSAEDAALLAMAKGLRDAPADQIRLAEAGGYQYVRSPSGVTISVSTV